jgi:hypothetical protein
VVQGEEPGAADDGTVGAEGLGKGVTQATVLIVEFTNTFAGDFKPADQGSVGDLLSIGNESARGGVSASPEPFDLTP